MPLVQGSSRQAISENIRRERDANKPLKQAVAIAMDVARHNRAEGGRAEERPKPPLPRPNPFRRPEPPRPLPVYTAREILERSYRNLERQMGHPEIDAVLYGDEKIKNYPELRPTTQQDLDRYWAHRGEFYRGEGGKLRIDPTAIDRMPQSDNIEYRWPVTPDDLYGDRSVREPLGAIRNYAAGGRAQVIQRAGLIQSTVPGRTDKHSINVISGSYILPADHVAHLGQDNSMAGGKVLDSMFDSPRRKTLPTRSNDIVPIVVAGGEYLLEPDQVARVGDGDLNKGHNSLDAWVKSTRKKHISLLKSLPPPKTK